MYVDFWQYMNVDPNAKMLHYQGAFRLRGAVPRFIAAVQGQPRHDCCCLNRRGVSLPSDVGVDGTARHIVWQCQKARLAADSAKRRLSQRGLRNGRRLEKGEQKMRRLQAFQGLSGRLPCAGHSYKRRRFARVRSIEMLFLPTRIH